MTNTDTTWGIENGKLTTPVILLWRRPGVKMREDNLTGAVAHNTEVEILDRKQYKERWYVNCKCVVMHEGYKYLQHGWCMDSLLKGRGK